MEARLNASYFLNLAALGAALRLALRLWLRRAVAGPPSLCRGEGRAAATSGDAAYLSLAAGEPYGITLTPLARRPPAARAHAPLRPDEVSARLSRAREVGSWGTSPDTVAYQWHVSHREHNRLHHALHGNGESKSRRRAQRWKAAEAKRRAAAPPSPPAPPDPAAGSGPLANRDPPAGGGEAGATRAPGGEQDASLRAERDALADEQHVELTHQHENFALQRRQLEEFAAEQQDLLDARMEAMRQDLREANAQEAERRVRHHAAQRQFQTAIQYLRRRSVGAPEQSAERPPSNPTEGLRREEATVARAHDALATHAAAEHTVAGLADLNDDCVYMIISHAASAMGAAEADFTGHDAYMRRALFHVYCWVARAGATCAAMRRAAALELRVRRATRGSALHHLSYTWSTRAAIRGDGLANASLGTLRESLTAAHAREQLACNRQVESTMIKNGRSFVRRREAANAVLASMLNPCPSYVPGGGRAHERVALLIQGPDPHADARAIYAAMDAPLADVINYPRLDEVRLLLDGGRLDIHETPRNLGLHLEDEEPYLQLAFEQVGGGDPGGAATEPGADQGMAAQAPSATELWERLVDAVWAHGNPYTEDGTEHVSEWVELMDIAVSGAALDAAAGLLAAMGRTRRDVASERALHAYAITQVYDVSAHQACQVSGARSRTVRTVRAEVQVFLDSAAHAGPGVATEAPRLQATHATRPARACRGCAGCNRPNCDECDACLDRLSGNRTLRRKCRNRACVPAKEGQAPLDEPAEAGGAAPPERAGADAPAGGSDANAARDRVGQAARCPRWLLGGCAGCNATDCGSCRYCLDKVKFGGYGTLRQKCERRRCLGPLTQAMLALAQGAQGEAQSASGAPPPAAGLPPPPPPSPPAATSSATPESGASSGGSAGSSARARPALWKTSPALKFQRTRPKKGRCGSMHYFEKNSFPLVCSRTPHCHGCWQVWRVTAKFEALAYPNPPNRVQARGVPNHVAAASLAAPFLLTEAADGAGRTLLLGQAASIFTVANATRGGARDVSAERLQCLGIYVGDTLRTIAAHHAKCEETHDEGSHAVAILDYVLCAASNPKGVALLCEGGWVNAFLRIVELHVADGTAEGLIVHTAGVFAAEDIFQETEVRILYDDSRGSYSGVRVARDYQPAERDPRGPSDFSAAEIATLPDQVWSAFSPEQLALALRYGGVEDYGVMTPDRNVTRERGRAPPEFMAAARPYVPGEYEATLGTAPGQRGARAVRREAEREARQARRPLESEYLERSLGRHVPNTEEGDAVARAAAGGRHDSARARFGEALAGCCLRCGRIDDASRRLSLCEEHRPLGSHPPTKASESGAATQHAGAGLGISPPEGWTRPSEDHPKDPRVAKHLAWVSQWEADEAYVACAEAVGELASPQPPAEQSACAAASPAPKRAATIHPAYGVEMGASCSEEERHVKRRARFGLTPGVAVTAHVSSETPKSGPALHEQHERAWVPPASGYCGAPPHTARDLPPLINPFPTGADPTASTRAYLEWVSSGKTIETVAKRHAITAPLLVEGEEAKALRGHAYDVLATLGQKILGGVHVYLACNCDPPAERGHEARAEHNCACHGGGIARWLNVMAGRRFTAERAEEAAATEGSRQAAPEPSASHAAAGAPRTRARSGGEDDKFFLSLPDPVAPRRKRPKSVRWASPPPEESGDEDYAIQAALSASEAEERVYDAIPELRGKEGTCVLHLFAGPLRGDGLASALARLGEYRAVEFDRNEREVSRDLADPDLQNAIVEAIDLKLVRAVLLGTPCESYSTAHNNGEAAGEPWRSTGHPGGRPGLNDQQRAYLKYYDRLLDFSVRVLEACLGAGTPAILENPAPRDDPTLKSFWPERSENTVAVWNMECVTELRARAAHELLLVVVPQCAFGPGPHGKVFQKYTGLLCTRAAAEFLDSLGLSCHHKKESHDTAAGLDEHGNSNSKLASAYPSLMYLALAAALVCDSTQEGGADALAEAREQIVAEAREHMKERAPAGVSTPPTGVFTLPEIYKQVHPPPDPPAAAPAPPPSPRAEELEEEEETDDEEWRSKERARRPAPEIGPPGEDATAPSRPRPLTLVEKGLGSAVPSSPHSRGCTTKLRADDPGAEPPCARGGSTTLPLLTFGAEPAVERDSVIIVPVQSSAITKGAPLALMPLHSGTFGVAEAQHARGGRREAVVDTAAAIVAEQGLGENVCFLAGELDALGRGFDDAAGVRVSVVVAPCRADAMRAEVALNANEADALRARWTARDPGAEPHAWMSLDALAAHACTADDTARYRAAAAAVAMAEAHVRPSPDAPCFVRSGARARRHAQAPTSEAAPGAISLAERMRRSDVECEKLHKLLSSQDAAADPGFAAFCEGLAEQVSGCSAAQVPEELLPTRLPKAPDDLLERAFRHKAQVLPNLPRTRPAAQEPPEDDWWPKSIEDIVMPEPLGKIRDWLRRCAQWHKRGGRESERPAPEAYGEDALYPRARGRRWDLRRGPGRITLWRDYTEEECQARTCINLKFAKELFADCADEEFVEFLTSGVRFHAGLKNQIVLQANLLSLYREGGVDAAAAQADDMVRQGFIAVFDDLPSVPYRVIPRGVVPKAGTDELRGIADQGAPRKPLYTKPAPMPGQADAARQPSGAARGERVEALNDKCRADPEWDHEDKDDLGNAAFNGAILQALADITGESTIEIALDMSKWFHRMFYAATELWTTGALIPDGASGSLRLAIEMAMTMGATPASQIAQRFANAMVQKVCVEMDELERAARETEPLPPELRRTIDRRNKTIPPDSYSSQGRLYDLTYYSDDGHAMVIGASRAVRFLRAFWTVAGADGLNAPLSRAGKQQIGACVVWLGGTLAAGLGLVWIPREKISRAALGLSTVLGGRMQVGDYRRLVGFLVSILFMLGNDPSLINHIFRPLKPNCSPPNEIDSGPATLVEVDELMGPVLRRWAGLILNTPGAPAMCAVTPQTPAASAPKHRIRTDAALQGTPRPGLGGCMYGLWWAVPIADHSGLAQLDIPHLELLAAGLGIVIYGEILEGAEHIELDTDALATAAALQNRAKTPAMQAILDALHANPVYQRVARRLSVSHLFGAANVLSDAASRGYDETLQAVAGALGIVPKRVPLSEQASSFLSLALDKLSALRPGAGLGSTAIHRGNLNMQGDHPIAHGAGGPEPMDESPTRAPLQSFWPRAGGSAPASPDARRRTPPSNRRTAYADGPARKAPGSLAAARTPPSPARPMPQRPRTGKSYAQAVSPTAMPLPAGPSGRGETPGHAQARGGGLRAQFDAAHVKVKEEHAPRPHGIADRWAPAGSPTKAPLQHGPGYQADLDKVLERPPLPGKARQRSELERARDHLTTKMFDRLRSDNSEHALQASDEKLRQMCEWTQGDPDDTPLNTQSNLRSNWRHWENYCAWVGPNTDPWRPNIEELDALGVERERVFWTAALIWIYKYDMKPKPGNYYRFGEKAGQLQPPQPKSALAVLRGIRKEHLDRGRTPPSLTLATRRMHELTAAYAKLVGPENMATRKRRTLTHEQIRKMLKVKEGTVFPVRKPPARSRLSATDDSAATTTNVRRGNAVWTWRSAFGVSCLALISTLAQTGFRKAEVALGDGEWGKMNISFANLTWRFKGKPDTACPSAQELLSISEGDFAIIRPPPSKCDQQGMRWGNSPIWLPYSASASFNAARALASWELHAQVKPERRRSTPLFCGALGVGSALTEGVCDDVFHGLLGVVLEDAAAAKEYSVHSFRSFLASSMLAAKCTDPQIQAALRWSSTEALNEYKRINAEDYGEWILKSEQQRLTGAIAADLANNLPRTDDLDLHQAVWNSRMECRHEAAVADRDVGSYVLAESIPGRGEPEPPAWLPSHLQMAPPQRVAE